MMNWVVRLKDWKEEIQAFSIPPSTVALEERLRRLYPDGVFQVEFSRLTA